MHPKFISGCIFIFMVAIPFFFLSCSPPEPIAFKAKVGMKKKQVEILLGQPLYSGGFVASIEPNQNYSPQRDRYLLLYVYRDSSLIVFKHDTVFEMYGNVKPYKQRLVQEAEKRKQYKELTY